MGPWHPREGGVKRKLKCCVGHRKRNAGGRGGGEGQLMMKEHGWGGRFLTRSQKSGCHHTLHLQTASLLLPKKYNFWLGAWLHRKINYVSQSPLQVGVATWLSLDQWEEICRTSRLLSYRVEECPPLLLCCWNVRTVVMSPLGPFR